MTALGGTGPVPTSDHAARMDRMYRYQRHIYDLTRKYYLLGRDRAIRDLQVPVDGTLLEVGCGTGRNLCLPTASIRAPVSTDLIFPGKCLPPPAPIFAASRQSRC